MNEEIPSVGASLRLAREAQGLSLDQAAGRLRLMVRQLSAMEADDFAALGQPVFARGFVRNYARMLGLDAEALVSRLANTDQEELPVIEPVPMEQPRSLLTTPWVLGAVAALVILIAIPVALYLWLNSGEEPARVSVTPIRPITQPIGPAAAPAQDATQPTQPEPPVPAAAPVQAPVAAASPASTSAPAPAQTPPTATPDLADQTDAAAPVAQGTIKLDFDADAWVEINEESGRVLLHKLNPAGSSVTVTGTPPFTFVIGNAAQVRMTYNGRPLDLTPYIDIKVARFNLEQ